MSEREDKVEEFFDKSRLTLDLAGLTEEERQTGSVFLGGSAAEFVESVENFHYDRIGTVVFRWGDEKAEDVFANLLEHIESPHETILPFAASTVIKGNIWALALQDKEFSTEKAYRNPEDFIELPFDEDEAKELLAKTLASGEPKQILGKVGSRYVLFEMATALSEGIEETKTSESVPEYFNDEEVIEVLERLVENWDFEANSDESNSRFAFHIAHWVVENFGQNLGENGWALITRHHQDIDGAQLPAKLQPLISYLWLDELHLDRDNAVMLRAKPEYIETDPVIPRWDEIEKLETFEEQVNFVLSNVDIIRGIVPTKVSIIPQVSVIFEPSIHRDWGIEFLANELGSRLAPFGREGKTMMAADFVRDMHSQASEIAKIVCQLSLLCAKFSQHYSGEQISKESIEALGERISGNAPISADSAIFNNMETYQPKPENAIKNLLIKRLRELRDKG